MNPEVSLGRIVHFTSQVSETHPDPAVMSAIVTKVWEDGSVNLTIFLPVGGFFYRKKVQQGTGTEPGTWFWPPRV